MKSSTKDSAKGKLHRLKGKIKETIGKAFGKSDLEAEGKTERIKGKVQEKIGGLKKILGK